jgi:hypothetical protein
MLKRKIRRVAIGERVVGGCDEVLFVKYVLIWDTGCVRIVYSSDGTFFEPGLGVRDSHS